MRGPLSHADEASTEESDLRGHLQLPEGFLSPWALPCQKFQEPGNTIVYNNNY